MDQKDVNGSLYMSSTTILALHQSLTVYPSNNIYDCSNDYFSTNCSESITSSSSSYEYQGNYNHSKTCHCIIDLSTPATLERDFYAWLNVNVFNPFLNK